MRAAMTLALIVTCATAWAQNGNWSDNKASGFSVINQTNKTLSITNEAELALLAYNVSNGSDYSDYTINLTTNLNMSDHYWDTPIGINVNNPFRGTFMTFQPQTGYIAQSGTLKVVTNEEGTKTVIMENLKLKNVEHDNEFFFPVIDGSLQYHGNMYELSL